MASESSPYPFEIFAEINQNKTFQKIHPQAPSELVCTSPYVVEFSSELAWRRWFPSGFSLKTYLVFFSPSFSRKPMWRNQVHPQHHRFKRNPLRQSTPLGRFTSEQTTSVVVRHVPHEVRLHFVRALPAGRWMPHQNVCGFKQTQSSNSKKLVIAISASVHTIALVRLCAGGRQVWVSASFGILYDWMYTESENVFVLLFLFCFLYFRSYFCVYHPLFRFTHTLSHIKPKAGWNPTLPTSGTNLTGAIVSLPTQRWLQLLFQSLVGSATPRTTTLCTRSRKAL